MIWIGAPPPFEDPRELVVDERGSEPRALLRYQVGAIDRDVRFRLVDDAHPEANRTIRYRWTCSPCSYRLRAFTIEGDPSREVRDDGNLGVTQDVGDVVVPADGHAEIKARGLMTTTPPTTELLDLVIVPFPKQPVGIGARWTVSVGMRARGFRLVSRTGDALTVEVEIAAPMGAETFRASGTLSLSLVDPIGKGALMQGPSVGGSPTEYAAHSGRWTLTVD